MACAAPRLLRHKQTRQYWEAPCQSWTCPDCARLLARRWRQVLTWSTAQGHAPQYLITLTLRESLPLWRQAPPAERSVQKAAAVGLARTLTRAFTRLVAEIRALFGPFEYVAFVELTTGRRTPGHRPHLHLLARGPALPKAWLSERWAFHSRGAFVVDIQPLHSPRLAADYMTSYTIGTRKKAQQQHLDQWPGPRIRYSRGYFPAPVQTIRTQLGYAVASSPSLWEWAGHLAQLWWHRWQAAKIRVRYLAAEPGLVSGPINAQEEPHVAAAKLASEDEPTQGRSWLTCPRPTGYNGSTWA